MADVYQQDLVARIASQLESAKYSDLTITCGGRTFHVHRFILCPASTFFAAACDGKFLEATKNQINLPDDDANAVERLLSYLYTGDYVDTDATTANNDEWQDVRGSSPITLGEQTPNSLDVQTEALTLETSSGAPDEASKASVHVDVSALTNNVLVHTLADKYDIPLLQDLALSKFEQRATGIWATRDILSLLQQVYANAPPKTNLGLRDAMLRVCLRYVDHLMRTDEFKEMLQENSAMCFDVLAKFHKHQEGLVPVSSLEQSTAPNIKEIKQWTTKHDKLLRTALSQNAICRYCDTQLELIMTSAAAAQWRGPINIKCRNCDFVFVSSGGTGRG